MRVVVLQLVTCFMIAAAGLIPVFHKNKPFWGAYGVSIDEGVPRLHEIAPDSPAETAGLQAGDVVLSVNGIPLELSQMNAELESLHPGEAAKLSVEREGSVIDLEVQGVEPPIAMIYYPTISHPIVGGIATVLCLILLATRLLQPAPWWRMALVISVGLGAALIFYLAIVNYSPFSFWRLRTFHNLNWGSRIHFEQSWVGLTAALLLTVLGAWELGSRLAGRSSMLPE